MTRICFTDIETLSLTPGAGIWEIGVVTIDTEDPGGISKWQAFIEPTPEELAGAEPGALRVNKFYEVAEPNKSKYNMVVTNLHSGEFLHIRRAALALKLAQMTSNAVLAGNVISFDAAHLEHLMRQHGYPPAWNYHLLDVEAFAAGVLRLAPPWNSKAISDALDVQPPHEAHTALGDALWAHDIYRAAMAYSGPQDVSETNYGFTWGPLTVERSVYAPERGYYSLRISTEYQSAQVGVSAKGRKITMYPPRPVSDSDITPAEVDAAPAPQESDTPPTTANNETEAAS